MVPKKLSYSLLACKPRVLHGALTGSICYLVYCSQEPILSLRLNDYNLSQVIIGCIFGINPLTYTISTVLIPYIVPRWMEHRVTMITGLYILAISNLLIGPFFADKNLTSMLLGLAISGFSMGFNTIPNMPEMMIATVEAYPTCDLDHANSLLSGMLNAGFGSGQALGPILGSLFYQLTSFRMTMNIISTMTAIYATLYLLTARGCQAYSKTCKNFSERNLPEEQKTRSVAESTIGSLYGMRHSAIFKGSLVSEKTVKKLRTLSLSSLAGDPNEE